MLVVARLFQGAGAALMVPQVLAFVQALFPLAERPRAFAFFGAVAGPARALTKQSIAHLATPGRCPDGCTTRCSKSIGGRCLATGVPLIRSRSGVRSRRPALDAGWRAARLCHARTSSGFGWP